MVRRPGLSRALQGQLGASRMERLPVKIALTERMRKFRAVRFSPS